MGTRSAICYRNPDATITCAYCHWDGYPDHHMPILEEHYNTLEKVQALVAPGSMSSLRTENTWQSDYARTEDGSIDFFAPRTHQREPQPLYHHERGDGEPPSTHVTLDSAMTHWKGSWCEHLYVYEPTGGWIHHDLSDV